MIRLTTLTFVFNARDEVLMIEKKRGMGAGRWNFPGGKIDAGETAEAAAAREVREETGIMCGPLRFAGVVDFKFPPGVKSWNNLCRIFVTDTHTGTVEPDSEECRAFWWPIRDIPFDKLWPDDVHWVPDVIAGRTVGRRYTFGPDDELLSEERLDPETLLQSVGSHAD